MVTRTHYNYRTGNSVHNLFRRLPKQTVNRLARQTHRLAISHGLTYTNEEGRTAVINLTLRPRLIHKSIERELWKILLTLDGAFQKVARFYFQIPSLYELFPFSARERDWLSCLQEPTYQEGRLATRWDANTTFSDEEWKEGFAFFEVNGVGVGGMWYGPQAAEVTLKTVVPVLKRMDPHFKPIPTLNMGLLLLDLILRQRKKLRRTRGVIALVMEKASGSNFVEFERLAKLYQRLGCPTIVAEPTDFYLRGDKLFTKNRIVDLLYRDTTLSELTDLEEKGFDVSPLRTGFRRGQIISSLQGEFDHKSVFEVFTNPIYSRFFTQKERTLFKRHILWTRLLNERKTTEPNGRLVDLIPFALKRQAGLVLKPNRLYGGKGIVFGHDVTQASWRRIIETALEQPGEWVIQQLGKLRRKSFFSPSGRKVHEKNFYVVSGFFATPKGLGMVGRMSERKIVNVAQRGGLTPILLMK